MPKKTKNNKLIDSASSWRSISQLSCFDPSDYVPSTYPPPPPPRFSPFDSAVHTPLLLVIILCFYNSDSAHFHSSPPTPLPRFYPSNSAPFASTPPTQPSLIPPPPDSAPSASTPPTHPSFILPLRLSESLPSILPLRLRTLHTAVRSLL
jgi:hypothetical protein